MSLLYFFFFWFLSSVSSKFCSLRAECSHTVVEGTSIICDGRSSCGGSKISGDYLECSGGESCEYSQIFLQKPENNANSLRIMCSGDHCLQHSTINITSNITNSYSKVPIRIMFEGDTSGREVTIYSGKYNFVQIYWLGCRSGIHSNIFCEEGSICKSSCFGIECLQLTTLYCHENSIACNSVCHLENCYSSECEKTVYYSGSVNSPVILSTYNSGIKDNPLISAVLIIISIVIICCTLCYFYCFKYCTKFKKSLF